MPFSVSVPLPGPFRWPARLGHAHRRHRGRFRSVWYWLSGLAVLELAAWALVAAAWLAGAAVWCAWRLAVEVIRC